MYKCVIKPISRRVSLVGVHIAVSFVIASDWLQSATFTLLVGTVVGSFITSPRRGEDSISEPAAVVAV